MGSGFFFHGAPRSDSGRLRLRSISQQGVIQERKRFRRDRASDSISRSIICPISSKHPGPFYSSHISKVLIGCPFERGVRGGRLALSCRPCRRLKSWRFWLESFYECRLVWSSFFLQSTAGAKQSLIWSAQRTNNKVKNARRTAIAARTSAVVDLAFAVLASSNISACAAFWRFDAFSSR